MMNVFSHLLKKRQIMAIYVSKPTLLRWQQRRTRLMKYINE